MCEAWEDILMQMDLRLTKFVQVSCSDFVVYSGCDNRVGLFSYVELFVLTGEEHKHSGPR